MYIGFRISAMHFDAVAPVLSIALIHLAEVLWRPHPVILAMTPEDLAASKP